MIMIIALMLCTFIATYTQEDVAKSSGVGIYLKSIPKLQKQRAKWFYRMNALLKMDMKNKKIVPTHILCIKFGIHDKEDGHKVIQASYRVDHTEKYKYKIDLYPKKS